MKAISLWQPWASLIGRGKSIETRSWPTSYRGPLAIHAAKSTKGVDLLPGDCDGKHEAGATYGYIGNWQAVRESNGVMQMSDLDPNNPELTIVDLPLGAIVATCTLFGCLKMDMIHRAPPGYWLDHGWNIEQNLPFGDFSDGRFAWLLSDIRILDEPVSCKGRQGLFEVDL